VYSTSSTSSSSDWLKDLSANEKAERCTCRPIRRLSPSTCVRYAAVEEAEFEIGQLAEKRAARVAAEKAKYGASA
jgi:hypothetical protein